VASVISAQPSRARGWELGAFPKAVSSASSAVLDGETFVTPYRAPYASGGFR
jgi:hypothetical protein